MLSLLLDPGVVGRGPVHAWNFPAHRPNVGAELSAVMDSIKQGEPQKSPDRVLEKDFLFPADHPRLVVPRDVIKIVQFPGKRVVVKFIGRNHFFQRRGTIGRMTSDSLMDIAPP